MTTTHNKKNIDQTYGADSRASHMMFTPESLFMSSDPKHALYDTRADLPVSSDLVASIKLRGVVTPIIVWRDPDDGKTYIVNGRQRVKALVEANRQLAEEGQPAKLVAAVAAKGKASDVLATMVIANAGAQEVSPIEKARLAQRLQVSGGYTDEHVAIFLHVSRSGLKNLLSLVESTTKEVQAAVASGALPVTAAYKLAKQAPEKQREQLGLMMTAIPAPPDGAEASSKKAKPAGKRAVAAAQRAAVGEVTMRRRPEIQAKLDELVECYSEADELITALKWVLGERKNLP
jgi:ParB family chromosome partitioning protein